jgi:hypothetical protein
MKRQMFFATAFSAALAVSAAAQTGTPPQTGAPQQEKQSSQQVTMTGCLQQASSGVAGTSGAPTAGSSEKQFILANATPASGGTEPGTAGTAGTAGAASSSAMGNRFRLVGGDREDLEKYLNSKVEIRGTLEKSGYSAPGAAATGAAPGTPEQGKADDKLPILRVTSVKQIAETCAGGN